MARRRTRRGAFSSTLAFTATGTAASTPETTSFLSAGAADTACAVAEPAAWVARRAPRRLRGVAVSGTATSATDGKDEGRSPLGERAQHRVPKWAPLQGVHPWHHSVGSLSGLPSSPISCLSAHLEGGPLQSQ